MGIYAMKELPEQLEDKMLEALSTYPDGAWFICTMSRRIFQWRPLTNKCRPAVGELWTPLKSENFLEAHATILAELQKFHYDFPAPDVYDLDYTKMNFFPGGAIGPQNGAT